MTPREIELEARVQVLESIVCRIIPDAVKNDYDVILLNEKIFYRDFASSNDQSMREEIIQAHLKTGDRLSDG